MTQRGLLAAIRHRLAWVYLGAGLAVAAAYLVSDSDVVKAVTLPALYWAALGAMAVGIRLHRPSPLGPWLAFAGAVFLWAIAWTLWEWHILARGATPPTESLINFVFLCGYPLMAAGLLYLLARREPDGIGVVDFGVIAVGAGIAAWAFLVYEYVGQTSLPPLGRGVQVAYAIGDVLVVSAAIRLLVSPGRRSTAFGLLVAAFLAAVTSDAIWNWSLQLGTYTPGWWADAGWLLFPVGVGAAALHRTMARVAEPVSDLRRTVRWDRLAVLGVMSILPPVVMLNVDRITENPVQAAPVATGAALIGVLILTRMVVILRQQDQLYEQVAAQNARLLELDRLKDSFVASVSHELRTPLTSIRGYLELVREGEAGDLTPEQDRFLGVVARNADRLLRVVGDLLFVAQVDAGKISLELDDVDLNAVALQSVEAARPHALEKRVELTLTRDPEALVRGDAGRLSQLVDNLLSNALKFTPEGGRVSVRIGVEGDRIVLEVGDTGLGISAEDQELLFQRFFRTSNANEQAIQGTGLGLSITKAIAEAHGGSVSVTSALGQGTTFRVELPAARVSDAPLLEPAKEVTV